MRRYSYILILFLSTLASAQTTSVTGTITDPSSQSWYGGTYNFQLMFSDGSTTAYYNGNPLPSSNYIVKGTLDGSGAFSVSLYDNSKIAPANTYWRATICSNTASPTETTGGTNVFVCFNADVTISGVSQDLTSTLASSIPVPKVNALLTPHAYNSSELDPSVLLGGLYWDVNTGCLMVWNGTSWGCIGSGGSTFNCVISIPLNGSGAMVAATSATTYGCDQQVLTDFFGHLSAQSVATLAPYNGEIQLTSKNSWQPSALPANTSSWIASNVTTTSTRWVMPPQGCIDGQLLGQQSHDIDPTGTARSFVNCLNAGSAVNITATLPIVVTPNPITGTGDISCPTCGAGSTPPQMNNPNTPTLAVGGTPGAATVTYLVQGCQDGPICAYHTATSATSTVTTANATLSSSPITLSVYGDTLYGPRCYNIYRTVGGPSQGKIATCVGKKFIDTGVAGDGTTATNTNTTVLDAYGLTNPLPGCDKIPAAPYGIDGPPCSPLAQSDEFTWGNGTWKPGDANNPEWVWVNQGSCTATLTNGAVILDCPSNGSATNWRLLCTAVPTAPYTFVQLGYGDFASAANFSEVGFALRESATGKFETISTDPGDNNLITFRTHTGPTNSATVVTGNKFTFPPVNGFYVKAQNDATNLKYSYGSSGIQYLLLRSETITTFFTTAPDQACIAVNPFEAETSLTVDYVRRTQ